MTYKELQSLRKQLGLTTPAFCELLGIKQSTLYSYKKQREIPDTLARLVKLIEDDPDGMVAKIRRVK